MRKGQRGYKKTAITSISCVLNLFQKERLFVIESRFMLQWRSNRLASHERLVALSIFRWSRFGDFPERRCCLWTLLVR